MFEEGSFRRRPRGFRRKCGQHVKPYHMASPHQPPPLYGSLDQFSCGPQPSYSNSLNFGGTTDPLPMCDSLQPLANPNPGAVFASTPQTDPGMPYPASAGQFGQYPSPASFYPSELGCPMSTGHHLPTSVAVSQQAMAPMKYEYPACSPAGPYSAATPHWIGPRYGLSSTSPVDGATNQASMTGNTTGSVPSAGPGGIYSMPQGSHEEPVNLAVSGEFGFQLFLICEGSHAIIFNFNVSLWPPNSITVYFNNYAIFQFFKLNCYIAEVVRKVLS